MQKTFLLCKRTHSLVIKFYTYKCYFLVCCMFFVYYNLDDIYQKEICYCNKILIRY